MSQAVVDEESNDAHGSAGGSGQDGQTAPPAAGAAEATGPRVLVVLSGAGHLDGSEPREAVLTLLSIARARARAVIAAPDRTFRPIPHWDRSAPGEPEERNALVEAARLARGALSPLSEVDPAQVDAAIFPGGGGVATVLSNYREKGAICDVDPDVARLLRELLRAHKPMGFICLAPILAARVLGPAVGVRLTLGPRGTLPAKHAAVMGADVRPCPVKEIVVDENARVVSTPAYMYDDASLPEVAHAIERTVSAVLAMVGRRVKHAGGSRRGSGGRSDRPAPATPGTARVRPQAEPSGGLQIRRRRGR